MMDFRKRLQGSSCFALMCFLIVITPAVGVGHDEEVGLPLAEGEHHNLESGFSIVKRAALEMFCNFQRIFGWCQDHGKDRQKRSFPKERKQPQDDNTNPDEPNPKILVRVPRHKRHGHSHRSRGGKKRNRSRVAHLDKKPQRKRFSKKGGSVSVALLKNRRFEGRGGRKSKRVVVNGKWYGPKKKRNGNSTEPPPRATDHLAHLRKPLTGAALEKQQRRFVTNKAYRYRKARKERARKGNERMAKLRRQMEEQKKAAKEDDSFESYSSASSSSSFSDGGSASANAVNFGSSSTDEVKEGLLQKRPPKPKFAWHKHRHSHTHSPSHAHGHTHGNKKVQNWKKKFRPIKMTSRGRR